MIDISHKLSALIRKVILDLAASLDLAPFDESVLFPILEPPKDKSYGDLACTAALRLARPFRKSPKQIAELLVEQFKKTKDIADLVDKIEIAGPGFINFYLKPAAVVTILSDVFEQGSSYAGNEYRKNQNIILEFVSANPTGPLNAVSARAAAIGDILANILQKSGATVHREFYINDFGNQINLLGESVKARYLELLKKEVVFPENGYHGEYIVDIARDLLTKYGSSLEDKDFSYFADYAITHNLSKQKTDLENYGVRFDRWFSERTIHEQKMLDVSFKQLEERGVIYEQDGKRWFRSTQFGDDNDRVLIRENGIPTYFMADITYHQNKYERSFSDLIDIWGPDHHGYIPRLRGALKALGHPDDSFTVLIVQQVNLIKDGKPFKMSKRAGNIILMEDVISEVGSDAARFFFVMRTSDSQLDFDLDLAKKHTPDNPCFYVQYAHARIHSIYKKFEEQGGSIESLDMTKADLSLLTADEELSLIKKIGQFPYVVESCAQSLDVHFIPYYLYDLSALFHNYYNLGKENPELRVVSADNPERTKARLALVTGLRTVIHEGLRLLGVSAPESM